MQRKLQQKEQLRTQQEVDMDMADMEGSLWEFELLAVNIYWWEQTWNMWDILGVFQFKRT